MVDIGKDFQKNDELCKNIDARIVVVEAQLPKTVDPCRKRQKS